jgi:hypothetical protein
MTYQDLFIKKVDMYLQLFISSFLYFHSQIKTKTLGKALILYKSYILVISECKNTVI